MPVIPHFVSECLEDLKLNKSIEWPQVDVEQLSEDKVDYVVQINGKKRAILNESRDINQERLLDIIKSDKLYEKYLKNKSINKIIFVKNRLINLLIDE